MTVTDPAAHRPLCFVLMPFGSKPDPSGGPNINFDAIYDDAIKPGIEDAGLSPLRADEEKLGGIIHEQMFKRLLFCKYAVADLTTSNPNVLYELGIRHAARPRTTLTIYAASSPLPFDVGLLRTERYQLEKNNTLSPASAAALRAAVTEKLRELQDHVTDEEFIDSPLFKLVEGLHPELLLPSNFEFDDEAVRHNEAIKEQLHQISRIRKEGAELELRGASLAKLKAISDEQAAAGDNADIGVLTEIMETYRALKAWSEMIATYDLMPKNVQQQVRVRQMRAFAYNRRAESEQHQPGDRATALAILEELQEEQGYNPETCGLIGRIYKAQYEDAAAAGKTVKAGQYLNKSIEAYTRGFEADWRDYYPGINAITVLDAKGDAESLAEKDRLLPVVRFSVQQKMGGGAPTYWDYATLLELAVHAGDPKEANKILSDVLATAEEKWCVESTADNLRMIAAHQKKRNLEVGWIEALAATLEEAAQS